LKHSGKNSIENKKTKMNKYNNPKPKDWPNLIDRPTIKTENLRTIVAQVFAEVKKNGDEALIKYTHFYDRVDLTHFKVSREEITEAVNNVSVDLKVAIGQASTNITKFHEAQIITTNKIETTKGVTCWQETRPIQKVGLYIPGGTAPLFSTVLMLAIPAKLAGCEEIILCTPPNKQGKIADEILYAAQLIGVTSIFKVGGIQAIGALTFGTESIPKVNKVFGPGNQYVTAAKQEAFNNGVAIDMPAGPSELLVVADESARPNFVASDLLSQAEHGNDSQVICLVNSNDMISRIQTELYIQLKKLPRKSIAQKAISNSKIILMSNRKDTIRFVNEYAPEHLILAVSNEGFYMDNLMNAGSVFIGNYTPESAGDYASGTNHTLPTNGSAKAFSGVNMDAFVKKITFQKITKEGINNIGEAIELMAEAEMLQAHKNAVTLRLKENNEFR